MRILGFVQVMILLSSNLWANFDSSFSMNKHSKLPKFCSPRIIGMSPNKVISLGWDHEFKQKLESSPLGSFNKKENTTYTESATFKRVNGLRFTAKAPLINKPKLIWQLGLNYWRSDYVMKTYDYDTNSHRFGDHLTVNGLRSSGINTSIYKPLNEKHFIIAQIGADLNGMYSSKNRQPLSTLKYSMLAMYGQKPSDRKQWAVGVVRAYGAGEASIMPLFMFNYTDPSKKWGAEIMLPARAFYRRVLTKTSLLRAGLELEGGSYRITGLNPLICGGYLELRRGELRTKVEYQRKLYKSFWLAAQTGYVYSVNYKVDSMGIDEKEITRGFFGKQPYAMLNNLSNFMFLNFSINYVSL